MKKKSGFFSVVFPNLGTQAIGDELRAEANAEHRLILIDDLLDEGLFGGEPRILLVIRTSHRPAHHDQTLDFSLLRQGFGGQTNIGKLFSGPEAGARNTVTIFNQPRLNATETFKFHMLNLMNIHVAETRLLNSDPFTNSARFNNVVSAMRVSASRVK